MLRWVALPVALAVSLGLSALLLGRRTFDRLVRSDVEALFAHPPPDSAAVVTEDMLEALPAPVRRYLTFAGVVSRPLVRTVHLKQKGKLRPAAGQPWVPLDAEQHYTIQPPGFVWDGSLRLGPLPLARGRDQYRDGAGQMLIKLGSLVTVVDGTGEAMDQGAMMRYLSEMIWFPAAFLGDNVSFEAVDDTAARVTLTDRGRSVTGTMSFDREGRLTDFVAKRYRAVGGGYELATWWTPVAAYGELEGLRLPVRGKAVWKLPDGDLEYIDVAITELKYNGCPGRTEVDGVVTVADAAARARATGLQGWELVAFGQRLAARKFSYSRRNPWDTPARAFERGMGYCQQQALALQAIYDRLGIAARPVYATRCAFPPMVVHGVPEPGGVGGHCWLRVRVGDEVRDVCCGSVENTPGEVHFAVLSPVRELYPWLQPLTHLGSVLENARRDWVAQRRQRRRVRLAPAPATGAGAEAAR